MRRRCGIRTPNAIVIVLVGLHSRFVSDTYNDMLPGQSVLPTASMPIFRRWYVLALLVLLPVLLYCRSYGFTLLQIDDVEYFLENPSLHNGAPAGLRDLWGVVYFSDYSPVSQLTIWLDLALGHGDSFVFARLQQLAWVGLGTLAIVQVVFRISGRAGLAYAVGILYCLHPVTAESALWLAERKNLVAFALTWWAIERHIAWRQQARIHSFLLALGLCALALLAKPHAIIIPAIIAAYEAFYGTSAWRSRLLAVAPSALMALAFTIISIAYIRWDLGMGRLGQTLLGTLACDGNILLRYLAHAYVPQHLAIFYRVIEDPHRWLILAGSWLCLAAIVLATVAVARDRRLVLFAWTAAGLSLVPAVNLVAQILPMSDHYLQWALPFLLIIPCQLAVELIRTARPLEGESYASLVLAAYAVLLSLLSWARIDEFSSYRNAMLVGIRHQPRCGINWGGYCHSLVATAVPGPADLAEAGRAGLTALRCDDHQRILIRPFLSSLIYGTWECQKTEGSQAADALMAQNLPQAGASGPFVQGMALLLENRPVPAQQALEKDYNDELRYSAQVIAGRCRSGEQQPWETPPCIDFSSIKGDSYSIRVGIGFRIQSLAALANAYRLNNHVDAAFALSALLVNLVPHYQAALALYRDSCQRLGLDQSVRRIDDRLLADQAAETATAGARAP